MKEYLKDIKKQQGFKEFVVKQKYFKYVEDNKSAVFCSDVIIRGINKTAAMLEIDGLVRFGGIIVGRGIKLGNDEFLEGQSFWVTEFPWLEDMMTMVENYNREVLKK